MDFAATLPFGQITMNATHAMPISYLTLLVLELNAELDTGMYDSIGLDDVKKAIQSETWSRGCGTTCRALT